MLIRPMTDEDTPTVAAAWNQILVHDQVSADRLRRAILADSNYQPAGVLMAETHRGDLVGFAACMVRRTVEGNDGEGIQWEFDNGFLKGFFVAEGDEAEPAAKTMLSACEDFCRGAGKKAVQLTMYSHGYLFPGLDVRYQRLHDLLVGLDYRDVHTIEDVAVQLRQEEVTARLESARRRAGPDAEVLTWQPELLPLMRRFVEEDHHPHWFPVGWESRYATSDEATLVLRRGNEIVGWAHFWPGVPRAGFGPVLVLPRARGNGYGSLLLLECMERARKQRSESMEAGWANTGFYVRHGWHITRRYAVLRKEL